MNAKALAADADLSAYADTLQSGLHCQVIGKPEASRMDSGWFYDTNYHLNQSGRTVNTKQWIRDIKAMLGITAATDIALPDMPAREETAAAAGDNADQDCFTCETSQGICHLTGLTEKGKSRDTLTVPAEWNGVPVRILDTGAFAGGSGLQRIILQENITQIADGAFSGCGSLKEIVLQNAKPEQCRVGQALLQGTDARLLVPAPALSAYRVSYDWSVYADRLQAISDTE